MTYTAEDIGINELLEMSESGIECFVSSPALNNKLSEMITIMRERNPDIPFSFAVVTYMLGDSLEEIVEVNNRDKIREDMSVFIDSIFELHERSLN